MILEIKFGAHRGAKYFAPYPAATVGKKYYSFES
jgi:hypothetical protein